jgi:hypothetical protein
MSWCPKCKCEFRTGFALCNNCGEKLMNEQPVIEPKIYPSILIKSINTAYNVYQMIILLIVPALIISSIVIYTSADLQNALIPNPVFNIRDELPDFTENFCFYNYAMLILNYLLAKKMPHLLKQRKKWLVRVFRVYVLLNTIVFGYYFYILSIYDVFDAKAWHLFNQY